jgi:uncharacterized repeat protein (TIGR01451 family)
MKKNLLIITILLALFMPTKAQWVTIPDANFATKLTQLFPSCMNGNLMDTTCSQIINATTVNLYNLNIYDLTGIVYFDNLINLSCTFTQLSNLPELPGKLKTLDCSDNNLLNINSLPDSLEIFWCMNNQLTSLPSLPNNLYQLRCNNNQLDILPILPNSLNLLGCFFNQLISLPNLPDSLQYLDLYSNQITNLPQLPSTLLRLSCENNQLTSIPALPNTLTELSCSNNFITSLPTLSNNLVKLNCYGNQLTQLPALPLTLSELTCQNNQLTSIPQVPSMMNWFLVNNNNISCLSNLPQVSIISDIANNPLTCVPNQTSYSLGLPLCMDNDTVNNPYNCTNTNITGSVFTDMNNDCVYNITDVKTENIPVRLFNSQNNLTATSYTINGVYSFATLQPDTYHVKIDVNTLPILMSCGQLNTQIVTLDSSNQTITNINFPIICNEYDLNINSISHYGWVFPGQIHSLITDISSSDNWFNLNCDSLNSGTITIQVNGPVTYISPANSALIPTVIGNTFTYSIIDFNTLTPASFGLKFLTDTTAQANDQICVHVEINPTTLDADTTNNVYNFCYQVVNSYDPNMKEVYPVNVLPGYDDWFTYTIHFQNTGNAPAFNIRLRDTLDANLDINTFEVRGYSHPAIVSINGNNLTVRFNNIMLPDSTTDYEGSIGYFQYRIKPLPNLPLGTQIENTAYIYFDYNTPIVTNTTQNNFQTVVSTFNVDDNANQLKVFPNPANEMLSISLQNYNIENCIITNALGQIVYNSANEINANHKILLNISNLSAGVYFVKVRSSNGTYNAKFIKSE